MIQRIILALAVSFSSLTTNFAQTQSPAKPAQSPPPAPSNLAGDKDDVVRITTNLVQVDLRLLLSDHRRIKSVPPRGSGWVKTMADCRFPIFNWRLTNLN